MEYHLEKTSPVPLYSWGSEIKFALREALTNLEFSYRNANRKFIQRVKGWYLQLQVTLTA